MSLRVLHEDASVLAFDKPAGLAVQGGSGLADNLEAMAARAHAKSHGRAPRLVHRLDRETSGVLVMARTKPAAAFLSKEFAERRAVKTYLAIVCGGAPDPAAGVIDLPLLKVVRRGVEIVRPARPGEPGAQAARTLYQTVSSTADAALIRLTPETGRMHQLRVHLSSIGRPIAGDGKYGGLFEVAFCPVQRLMLHAFRLHVAHPAGGALDLTAPAPADLGALAAALRLDGLPPPGECGSE